RSRGADVCMLVHADLALLSPGALDALINDYFEQRRTRGETVIGLVRCHEGTGTNLVILDPTLPFTPAFGPDSFAIHRRAAGGRAAELLSEEAAFDVDTAADLQRLAESEGPARLRPFTGLAGQEADPASLIDAPLATLLARAARLRDEGHGALITYSR